MIAVDTLDTTLRGLLAIASTKDAQMSVQLNRRVLQRAMQRNRMSQADLAQRAGLHPNTVYRLLADESISPNLRTVNQLAKALDLNPFTLLIDVDDDEF